MAAERAFRADERGEDGEPSLDSEVGAALQVEYRNDLRTIRGMLAGAVKYREEPPRRRRKKKKAARRG